MATKGSNHQGWQGQGDKELFRRFILRGDGGPTLHWGRNYKLDAVDDEVRADRICAHNLKATVIVAANGRIFVQSMRPGGSINTALYTRAVSF